MGSAEKVIQDIQYMIVPGVMVSSSALFLLGFQNKFSNLAARFRNLNHEKRLLSVKSDRAQSEDVRLGNLILQVDQIMKRAGYVKNAILSAYFGILCFISTSVLIFFKGFPFAGSQYLAIVAFLAGLFSLAAACVFMILETSIFYEVISLEHSFKNRRVNR